MKSLRPVVALAPACAIGFLFSTPAARAVVPPLEMVPVAVDQFVSPTSVTHAGDGSGRLFVTDQRGIIQVFKDGYVLPVPFLDLSTKLVTERNGFDERGLLGLAFHPDYGNAGLPGEGLFYVYYSAPSPNAPGAAADPVDSMSVVAEYRVSVADPEVADPASERILFTVDQPQFNHNAGQLAFGPLDGMLYITLGDGGSSNDNNAGHTGGSSARPANALGNAQDRTKLLGKLLRIDPLGSSGPGGQYGIPLDNPFVGDAIGIREEIYAFGLRNPWRFSFDDGDGGTNRLFLADVGQGKFEEVNLIEAGGNYGWRRFEGTSIFEAATPSVGPYRDPIAEYAHPGQAGATGLLELGLSVTGGYVYRGSAVPALQGIYLFGDWSTSFATPRGTLLALEEIAPGIFELSKIDLAGGNPVDFYLPAFGKDENGEVYVATKRVAPPSGLDPVTARPTGSLFRLGVPRGPGAVTLPAARDTTVFSENGGLSNGAGPSMIAGRTATGALRRGLVAFDLSALPEEATLTGAAVRMVVTNATNGTPEIGLHRLLSLWGEAGSIATNGQGASAQTGDATWTQTEFSPFNDHLWTMPGGDFVATPSATVTVAAPGPQVWSGPGLVADVRAWRDDPNLEPGANPGWLLRGDEGTPSTKVLVTKEGDPAPDRPQLTVTYEVAPPLTHRLAWERRFFPIGTLVAPDADGDADGLPALLEYAWALAPTAADLLASHLSAAFDAGPSQFTVTFRRDPLAVDLVYELQVGSTLGDWTTLVTSTGGQTPDGPGFVSEEPDPLDPALLRVTARETVPAVPGADARYARLRVTRP